MTAAGSEPMEHRLHSQSTALRARVLALALLGYAYVVVLLVGILAAAVGVVVLAPSILVLVWVTIPLLALAAALCRALWVGLPPPEGVRLAPADAPELFALLHELRRELRAPRLHGVWVDGSFNASVGQTPRLGIFGPYRNTLHLGLPLLQGVPAEELRAVLAHELAHVSRRHGRTTAWVYRVRETWERVLAHLETTGHRGVVLFRPFFRWYVPRFDRASLELARTHELEADAASARCAGVEAAAGALVRIAVANGFLSERFWPDFWEGARHNPTPPRPFALLGREIVAACAHADAERWLADALAVPSAAETTHPSLAARLAALGLEAERVRPRPVRVSLSAADALLGGERTRALTEAIGERWQEDAGWVWQAQHEEAQEAEARLAEAESGGSWHELAVDQLVVYAGLVSQVRGLEAARPLWERAVELRSDDAEALLALGELHARRGDPRGRELLERAAALEPLYAPGALATLARALAEEGRPDEAAECRRRAEEAQELLERAHAERSRLTPADELAPHGLGDDVVGEIAAVLDRKEVARGYLARKAPDALGDRHPVYVVGYVRRGGALRFERRRAGERLQAELLEALEPALPGPFWLVDVTEDAGRLHKRLRKVDGACIVRGGRSARPLARAAPVLVGLLLVGGIVGRFADDAPRDGTFADLSPAELTEAESEARFRWSARAEELCSVLRTHAALRLEDVHPDPAEPGFAEVWKVLRPFEDDLLAGLVTIPHAPPEAAEAVRSLGRDVALLERAAAAARSGKPAAAEKLLSRVRRDQRTEQAFAKLGIRTCPAEAPAVR
ncbi:MAG TPA: M48 family metallopeptidase [Gaiellaceae bacterium]|nr:M48 family metallopeptidase [Gaiellaceae bacterium]